MTNTRKVELEFEEGTKNLEVLYELTQTKYHGEIFNLIEVSDGEIDILGQLTDTQLNEIENKIKS